jgi:hypothetical protein
VIASNDDPPPNAGLVTSDHFVPFQRWTNV